MKIPISRCQSHTPPTNDFLFVFPSRGRSPVIGSGFVFFNFQRRDAYFAECQLPMYILRGYLHLTWQLEVMRAASVI